MIIEFEPVMQGLLPLVNECETNLSGLPADIITQRRNN